MADRAVKSSPVVPASIQEKISKARLRRRVVPHRVDAFDFQGLGKLFICALQQLVRRFMDWVISDCVISFP